VSNVIPINGPTTRTNDMSLVERMGHNVKRSLRCRDREFAGQPTGGPP
jgi:hypothetical protein